MVVYCQYQPAKNILEVTISQKNILKRFLVVENFSKSCRIGFISFNLSSLDISC